MDPSFVDTEFSLCRKKKLCRSTDAEANWGPSKNTAFCLEHLNIPILHGLCKGNVRSRNVGVTRGVKPLTVEELLIDNALMGSNSSVFSDEHWKTLWTVTRVDNATFWRCVGKTKTRVQPMSNGNSFWNKMPRTHFGITPTHCAVWRARESSSFSAVYTGSAQRRQSIAQVLNHPTKKNHPLKLSEFTNSTNELLKLV